MVFSTLKYDTTMHRLFERAMLWEMVDLERNPMELVEIKGISKRQTKQAFTLFNPEENIFPVVHFC